MFGFSPEFVVFSIVVGLITVGACVRAWRIPARKRRLVDSVNFCKRMRPYDRS